MWGILNVKWAACSSQSDGQVLLVCVQVSDHGVAVLELDSGLNFPVTEHLSRLVYTHALHGETHTLSLSHTHSHTLSFPQLMSLNAHAFVSVVCSVSSAVSGSRLLSRQLYRLHCSLWTHWTAQTVPADGTVTDLHWTKGRRYHQQTGGNHYSCQS